MSLPPPPADDGPVASPGPPRRESLPRGADTLFFAIRPAGPQAEAIARAGAALADEWGLQGRAVQAARLHVTLHFLGGFDAPPPSPLVDAARGAAAGIVAAPFEIVFDRVATFGRGSALAMCGGEGLADVTAFRRHLGEAIAAAGVRSDRAFRAHLTFMRVRQRVDERPIAPIRWAATEFALILSHAGGAGHETLGRWPLAA